MFDQVDTDDPVSDPYLLKDVMKTFNINPPMELDLQYGDFVLGVNNPENLLPIFFTFGVLGYSILKGDQERFDSYFNLLISKKKSCLKLKLDDYLSDEEEAEEPEKALQALTDEYEKVKGLLEKKIMSRMEHLCETNIQIIQHFRDQYYRGFFNMKVRSSANDHLHRMLRLLTENFNIRISLFSFKKGELTEQILIPTSKIINDKCSLLAYQGYFFILFEKLRKPSKIKKVSFRKPTSMKLKELKIFNSQELLKELRRNTLLYVKQNLKSPKIISGDDVLKSPAIGQLTRIHHLESEGLQPFQYDKITESYSHFKKVKANTISYYRACILVYFEILIIEGKHSYFLDFSRNFIDQNQFLPSTSEYDQKDVNQIIGRMIEIYEASSKNMMEGLKLVNVLFNFCKKFSLGIVMIFRDMLVNLVRANYTDVGMGSLSSKYIALNDLVEIIEEKKANLSCFHLFPALLRARVKIVECEALQESQGLDSKLYLQNVKGFTYSSSQDQANKVNNMITLLRSNGTYFILYQRTMFESDGIGGLLLEALKAKF